MRKYADFACKKCDRDIKDLPLDATRCPICGAKRGFKRLFNAVQVSTRGHRAARFIDKRMTPAMDQHTGRKQSAARFAGAVKEVEDRVWEQATAEQRAQIVEHKDPTTGMRRMNIPAATAFGAIDPIARHDSVNYTYPQVKRQVQPLWQK